MGLLPHQGLAGKLDDDTFEERLDAGLILIGH
jgi:hypothetical protein